MDGGYLDGTMRNDLYFSMKLKLYILWMFYSPRGFLFQQEKKKESFRRCNWSHGFQIFSVDHRHSNFSVSLTQWSLERRVCVQLYTVVLIIVAAGLKCHREQLGGISASGLQIQSRRGVNQVFTPCQLLFKPLCASSSHQWNSDGNTYLSCGHGEVWIWASMRSA